MKRILGILTCLLIFASTAFAADASIDNRKSTYNFQVNYPYITLENKEAANEINRFINKKDTSLSQGVQQSQLHSWHFRL